MTDAPTATEIARAVRSGELTARAVVDATLDKIQTDDPRLNCFTRIFNVRALADASHVDALVARGQDPGPLAGVPFAVKDLFDVKGVVTTAGAKSREGCQPAAQDAVAIRRLNDAGAVLIGTLNMDEFAYGFSTENSHYGPTRNPHDLSRLAGGSSGGSAASVAARFVPISLGSDTNGSVRVPASLCGVYGLRPTHGLISEGGVFPFVTCLDTVGIFARTLDDLALTFGVLTDGPTASLQVHNRIAVLTGWFSDNADDEARQVLARVAASLGEAASVSLRFAGPARSAAFLMTAAEGGHRHLAGLRKHAADFDPATRRRLAAGAMVPAVAVRDAREMAAAFVTEFNALMAQYDVLLAPATPSVAPSFSDANVLLNGRTVPARANLGVCTQPLSLTGAPSISVPVSRPGRLPLGVQMIAAKGREDMLFAMAKQLESAGIVASDCPPPFQDAA